MLPKIDTTTTTTRTMQVEKQQQQIEITQPHRRRLREGGIIARINLNDTCMLLISATVCIMCMIMTAAKAETIATRTAITTATTTATKSLADALQHATIKTETTPTSTTSSSSSASTYSSSSSSSTTKAATTTATALSATYNGISTLQSMWPLASSAAPNTSNANANGTGMQNSNISHAKAAESETSIGHATDTSSTTTTTTTTTMTTTTDAATQADMSFHQYCIAHRNSFADLFTLVLYSVVCLVGLFGNTLVIYVVLRFSKMQTVTNIYILNLAIADECFLIGIPFLLYTMRICSWRFGEFMCKAYMVSTSITQFTSSIFLLIMSADRYIAVCHPIASPRYRTLHIAKVVSALAWTTSAVLMLPVILYASTVEQEDGINLSCNIEWPETYKKHSGTTFILYTFLLGFATPLCFILCFYYLVIRKLQSVGPKKSKSKEKKRAHRKVTRLVLTVITVYICCWLPHWISQVALIHSNPAQRDLSRLEILIFLLLGCLVYSNSAMNPVLYAFLSDNFRKSFFKAFTCISQQDINAQLHLEPSVFTKQNSRRRGGSRRLLNPPPAQVVGLTLNVGNNNSSTTTSSTTTAEKTVTTGANKSSSSNGRLVPSSDGGNVIVRLDLQEPVTTLVGRIRRCSVDVQQTDL